MIHSNNKVIASKHKLASFFKSISHRQCFSLNRCISLFGGVVNLLPTKEVFQPVAQQNGSVLAHNVSERARTLYLFRPISG
ncbi:hypothetical protein DPMN_024188 [Dreissena polymorpha]|uniref:Uncharacterized protein n=1 Tax=Dreissena polymorpha TaxID=45954 RepID=A0A9D4LNN2_DREPO|nr:hypothetical protein DPMN_024188 [Dreissena polymorpha]